MGNIFSQILSHADSWWTEVIIFSLICYYVRKRRLRPKFIAEIAVIKCISKDIMNGYYDNIERSINQYVEIFTYKYQVEKRTFKTADQLLKLAIAQCVKNRLQKSKEVLLNMQKQKIGL